MFQNSRDEKDHSIENKVQNLLHRGKRAQSQNSYKPYMHDQSTQIRHQHLADILEPNVKEYLEAAEFQLNKSTQDGDDDEG